VSAIAALHGQSNVKEIKNSVLRVKIVKERWYHRLIDQYMEKRQGPTIGKVTLELAVDDKGFFVKEDIEQGNGVVTYYKN